MSEDPGASFFCLPFADESNRNVSILINRAENAPSIWELFGNKWNISPKRILQIEKDFPNKINFRLGRSYEKFLPFSLSPTDKRLAVYRKH
jgi:hypothetical protein